MCAAFRVQPDMGFLNNSPFCWCQTKRGINTAAAHLASSEHAQGLKGSQEQSSGLLSSIKPIEKFGKTTQTPETKGHDNNVTPHEAGCCSSRSTCPSQKSPSPWKLCQLQLLRVRTRPCHRARAQLEGTQAATGTPHSCPTPH